MVFRAAPELFRTGWFVESLLTELVIALVVRTRRPFFRSRPGHVLLWSTRGARGADVRDPLPAVHRRLRLRAAAGPLLVTVAGDYGALRRRDGSHQAPFYRRAGIWSRNPHIVAFFDTRLSKQAEER